MLKDKIKSKVSIKSKDTKTLFANIIDPLELRDFLYLLVYLQLRLIFDILITMKFWEFGLLFYQFLLGFLIATWVLGMA